MDRFLENHPEFVCIGRYKCGQFEINASWRRLPGVYVWGHRATSGFVPRRFGIACGSGGIGARHVLHNRWLAGLFKPDGAREQAVRRFTLQGLGSEAEVYGFECEDRTRAKLIEQTARSLYAEHLHVDLSVPGSVIKQQMDDWRRGGRL